MAAVAATPCSWHQQLSGQAKQSFVLRGRRGGDLPAPSCLVLVQQRAADAARGLHFRKRLGFVHALYLRGNATIGLIVLTLQSIVGQTEKAACRTITAIPAKQTQKHSNSQEGTYEVFSPIQLFI